MLRQVELPLLEQQSDNSVDDEEIIKIITNEKLFSLLSLNNK